MRFLRCILLELPKMGRLELFSPEDEVSRKLTAGSVSLTLQILKLHVSPPKITNHIGIHQEGILQKKNWDSIHAITHPCRKLMTEKWDQEGILLSSIHAINHPMTAIHDEEKGMGIQLPSVKVREVGPAWKPRLCQPSVRKVL